MENEENKELLEYRLSNIEKSLAKLEELLTNNKLQDRDIDDLQGKSEKLEQRVTALEARCAKLEEAPVKAKADRWGQTVDLIYRTVILAVLALVLIKIGLQ